jgi:hypothetical protein
MHLFHFLGLSLSPANISTLSPALSPVHTPARCFGIVVSCTHVLPLVPIVFPQLSFSVVTVVWNLPPFFPSESLFLVPLSILPFLTSPHRQLLNHRFNFDFHACGSLPLGHANFFLVPFPLTFLNGSCSIAVLHYRNRSPHQSQRGVRLCMPLVVLSRSLCQSLPCCSSLTVVRWKVVSCSQ